MVDASADPQYRLLFDSLADPAFVIDRDAGLFIDVNPAFARTYGYTRAELQGLNVTVLSADPEESLRALRQAQAPVNPRVHKRKDGTTFAAEASASAVDWSGRRALVGVVRDVTERVRVEQQLRDSQALLSNAFHSTPLLMSVCELPSDRYVEVNDTFCAVSGFSREETLGHTAVELGLITPQERDQLEQRLMESKGGAIDLVVRSRSGTPIHCRYWGAVLQTAEGLRLFAAAEDVTERQLSEKERQEALRRLEKIAAMVPGVVYQYRLRPDGTACFPFASAAIKQIYRVTPEEVREDASKVFTRLHPDDLAGVVATIQKSARELSRWRDEYRVKFEDGVVRWLRGDAVPEREADGSVLWHGYITDITERREADEALKKSEARFELAMDATSDGLWDWDLTTDAGYFSPGYYRMLGYGPDGFVASGQTWRSLIHPDDRQAAEQANQDCIEGRKERFEVEYRMKAKNGEWRWILGRGKCVARDANGRALRLLGTHVDITERKKLQTQLAQGDRLASMGMLAAGVAHEINNPLSYVLASLDALAQDLPRLTGVNPTLLADLIESAQSALEGTRRIRKISRGLSTFSRVERTELDSVDLNLAIETAATMAHNEVKFRATLVKDFGQIPSVRASDGKLAQVFLNLIINAAHAIGEGNVDQNRITVRTWASGDDVFAEVVDTGRGIPRENLERVFEPFYTTKKVGLGSGLGLSISRNIITEFGGDIRVESEVGKGTRMVVRLPAYLAKPAEPAPGGAVNPPTATVRGRILVVDDEEPIRRILARLLGTQHEVVTVASGREGKALLEKDQAFDLILCDLMMPELTGMDLHAWLVNYSPALARRVVFVSGGAFTPSAADYLARVDNLKLDKPFDPNKLLALAGELVLAARA